LLPYFPSRFQHTLFEEPVTHSVSNSCSSKELVAMARKRKWVNSTGIPDFELEKLAQCLWPFILKDYEKQLITDQCKEMPDKHSADQTISENV